MNENNKLGEFGLQFLEETALSDSGSIIITIMAGYYHIQIGSEVCHTIDSLDNDGKYNLQETLYKLEQMKFIKSINENPKSYCIADLGRNYIKQSTKE